jgi:hypothetical protein
MGMDLVPIKANKNYPRWKDLPDDEFAELLRGKLITLSYNWPAWRELRNLIESWGIPTSEFVDHNNGDKISETTCVEVAKAMEENIESIPEWLSEDIAAWKNSGGFRQW